jgi:hypothetical protein
MSRRRKKLDPHDTQLDFEFDFTKRVDGYLTARQDIEQAITDGPLTSSFENEFEVMMDIAVSAKKAIRESNLSREQVVDGINQYLGRSEEGAKADPPKCKNPLTLHMLNNYLSKPTEYPLQAYLLVALQHVTGKLYPSETILAYEGAQAVTEEEIKLLTLGKLEQTISNMNKLRRELKK